MADQNFPLISTGIALGIAGGLIERRSSNAVVSTSNEAHRAEYQAWTTSGALMSDVGMGLLAYGIYKRSPGWGIAAGLGLLAFTVMGTKNPEKGMNAADRLFNAFGGGKIPGPIPIGSATKTGWEPWERREWERRRREERREDPWRQWG